MRSKWTRRGTWAAVAVWSLLLITSCSGPQTLVVVLPEGNRSSGAVAVGEGDQSTVLDSPMTSARVDARGRIEKGTVTQAEVDRDFVQALAAQPPESMSFVLYFEEGSTTLVEESKNSLLDLLAEVAKRQAVEVQVTGHTDTVGTEVDNDRLSAQRAHAVREMLIQQGLQAKFVRDVGRGERELLIPTPDGVREPRNRRVEVIVR
jgi:OOP family OmpA-OmpF porin